MQILQVVFLQDLQDLAVKIVHVSCKSYTKNEVFLAKYKTSCKIFTRTKCNNFLAKFDQILQENYLTFSSCKNMARGFIP